MERTRDLSLRRMVASLSNWEECDLPAAVGFCGTDDASCSANCCAHRRNANSCSYGWHVTFFPSGRNSNPSAHGCSADFKAR